MTHLQDLQRSDVTEPSQIDSQEDRLTVTVTVSVSEHATATSASKPAENLTKVHQLTKHPQCSWIFATTAKICDPMGLKGNAILIQTPKHVAKLFQMDHVITPRVSLTGNTKSPERFTSLCHCSPQNIKNWFKKQSSRWNMLLPSVKKTRINQT